MSSGKNVAWPQVSFAVDRGGTFTDIMAFVFPSESSSEPELRTHKLLSQCPEYDDAPSTGIKHLLQEIVGEDKAVEKSTGKIDTTHIRSIRMGTTIATNALLEHTGVPSVLVVTKGFKDLLKIGTQARPDLFALNIKKTQPVSTFTVEATERVRIIKDGTVGFSEDPSASAVKGQGGESIEVVVPLDEDHIREQLKEVRAKEDSVKSIAISLLHGHTFTEHEAKIAKIARELGFTHVSTSHQLMPMIKYVPRTTTTSVDAYLTPLLTSYVAGFRAKFTTFENTELLFMQSDGGLTSANGFHGFRAVLSGPAGGVVGFMRSVTEQLGQVDIVGFDMGGTSTDVSRCEGDKIEHVVEAEVAGVTLQAPQLDIRTVAAGGGSILAWKNGMYTVGPDSAGAMPGPACYGRGGPLTVTDANLVLGHIHTEHFPKVFGKTGTEPLNPGASKKLFEEMAKTVSDSLGKTLSVEEVAIGFLAVANEAMSRPIRATTEAKGHRPADHVLAVFGGAGGQHGCSVADRLGIQRVFVPKHASVLSAVGIGLADIVEDVQRSISITIESKSDDTKLKSIWTAINEGLKELNDRASKVLRDRGFTDKDISAELFVNMRFSGTTTAMMIRVDDAGSVLQVDAIIRRFVESYKKQFGFTMPNRAICIDDLRVRASGNKATNSSTARKKPEEIDVTFPDAAQPQQTAKVYFDGAGWTDTPVVESSTNLKTTTKGPILMLLKGSTVVVEPGCTATVSELGNITIRTAAVSKKMSVELDPLPLSVFAHRFMSIAEQMGVALQRTALSTNIKERYDFSCGLFDGNGSLVANAPHIPVHLGAMGRAIEYQKKLLGDSWKPNDVIVTNDPSVGGSHLPDITVITPCWHSGRVVFFIASRGHHSDIGGSTPGSMPPFSKDIKEEGAIIRSFKLVEDGVFQEEGVTELLMAPGKIPGLSGCRAIVDVISDLKAQVAANRRGVDLITQLIDTTGLDVVEAYMGHIQNVAESSIRGVLKNLAKKYGSTLEYEDAMDDGTTIAVKIDIDEKEGAATFDWTKCGSQVIGSTNCPVAVVRSAILYSLRCLVGDDIPLNEGAMRPITVLTKPSTILHPQPHLPVVGGNVLTSQRITDVILMAMRAVACSQGCMNNFTFGNDKFAYYETIAGGSGAGDGFDGASAVQTHMTNTRITDPEIMEVRYPLLLTEFSIRTGSGGKGKWMGGEGVRRTVLFLADVHAVLLSERRALQPRGLSGGGDGARGLNLVYASQDRPPDRDAVIQPLKSLTAANIWTLKESLAVNIGAKNTVHVKAGETVLILTPGGGGFGQHQ